MHKTDLSDSLSRLCRAVQGGTALRDLRAGLALLSRLPLPAPKDFPTPPAVWAWPLVGLILGALSALAGWLAFALGTPAGFAAAAVLAAHALVTGAMHEDGLADTADGLWGGWDKARRLEIMKDSHIGSYGVMALILVTLGRWSAVTALIAGGHWMALVVAATISRAPMAAMLSLMPNARGAGLSQSVGQPAPPAAGQAVLVALLLALLCSGFDAIAMTASAGLAALALWRVAMVKIGGQTGDILGASQQLSELAALGAAAAIL